VCGIIGVHDQERAAEMAMLGLFAEQHRGQESCGMAVSDGRRLKLRKKMGLVKQVFTPELLAELRGNIAIGHVRYPTCGSATEFNSQPHTVETLSGPSFALASNGDLVNYQSIRNDLESKGVYFASDNDGELLIKYIVYQVEKCGKSIVEGIKSLMENIKGAYSTVLATREELYMFRDPNAIRPMVWGIRSDGVVVAASESCALDILGIREAMEVRGGEIIVSGKNGVIKDSVDAEKLRGVKSFNHCMFEHVYFSRPDSFHFGENVYRVRQAIGQQLAEDDDCQADMVVPVPDSANFIALGYARKKEIPYEMGLIRNHYVGRTFIKPEQTIRDESVHQKFNTLPFFFQDKRIVLIDDSIVRGTTIRNLIRLIKNSGANEVHLRIGSPQVKYSCYYGIDTPTKNELIANKLTLEKIREYIGADSIKHLSINKLRKTVHKPDDYCYACFDGNYPIKPERELDREKYNDS